MPELLIKLQSEVARLHSLLADPEPGLMTWNGAVCDRWKAIAEMWDGNPRTIALLKEK